MQQRSQPESSLTCARWQRGPEPFGGILAGRTAFRRGAPSPTDAAAGTRPLVWWAVHPLAGFAHGGAPDCSRRCAIVTSPPLPRNRGVRRKIVYYQFSLPQRPEA
jgi:hypothetical protein